MWVWPNSFEREIGTSLLCIYRTNRLYLYLYLFIGFHTLFTIAGFRCLDRHMFLQYLDHGVLHPTEEFISRLMDDIPDDSHDNVEIKFQIITRLPRVRVLSCVVIRCEFNWLVVVLIGYASNYMHFCTLVFPHLYIVYVRLETTFMHVFVRFYIILLLLLLYLG